MDQARDSMLVNEAYQKGSGYLPLLGPKAGGTQANVGPAFYYFQYIPTVIFHSNQPDVMAYSDLLFSILSIFLLYALFKKYFSRDWSMILVSAYALCFLGIQYSRFAWNPNSLPFFNILFFYSLLSVFDEKVKYRLRWALAAGFSFAISTQLHFLSFFTLPLITLIFLYFNRKNARRYLNWKIIAIFIFIAALIYVPVIANEIHSHGHAVKEFIKALHSKPDNHTFFKKIVRDVRYFGQNWFIIFAGYISKKKELAGSAVAWIIFIIPAIVLNYLSWKKEKDNVKKNFLLITLIWFPTYLLAYIPIAYDIRPRFFLPMLFLPFAYLGYIANFLAGRKQKILQALAYLIVIAIIAGNLIGTCLWFREIMAAQKKGVYPSRTIILKSQDGIVLWHLEKATEYMAENCSSERIYYYSNSEYKRPIKYLLSLKGKDPVSVMNMEKGGENCVFATYLTRAKKLKLSPVLADKFDIESTQKFGALSVDKLVLREGFVGQELNLKKQKDEDAAEKADRLYWKDVIKKF
ncbi:MAG: glycosyltransferase family 39 protein [Parcubacteria group bacterium]